jgi:hypothetical protein
MQDIKILRKQAEKFIKDNPKGFVSDTLQLKKGESIDGFFVNIETKKSKKTKKEYTLITMKNEAGVIFSLWSWGLLTYKINELKPALVTGDYLFVKKLPKMIDGKIVADTDKKGFWGAYVVTQSLLESK